MFDPNEKTPVTEENFLAGTPVTDIRENAETVSPDGEETIYLESPSSFEAPAEPPFEAFPGFPSEGPVPVQEEDLLTVEAPDPAPDQSSKPGSHKRLTLALIALAVVLLAVGGFVISRLMRHPLSKAYEAAKNTGKSIEASPVFAALDKLESHGSVTLRVDLSQMQDLVSSLVSLPIKLDASADFTLYRKEGSMALGMEGKFKGKTLLDGLLIYNEGKDIAISSEALFGKTNYGLNLKNLGRNLEGSLFDPASNGMLALPEKLFNYLKSADIQEGESQNLVKESQDRLDALFLRGIDFMSKKASFSTDSAEIRMGGESLKAGTLTMRFNEEVLFGLTEDLIDFIRNDKEFNDYLLKLLNKMRLMLPYDNAEKARDALMEALTEWQTKEVPSLKKQLQGTEFTVLFYTYQDHLIRLDMTAEKGGKEYFLGLSIGPDPKALKEFSLEFREPGGSVVSATYQVSARSNDQYTARLTLRSQASDIAYLSINWNRQSGALTVLGEYLGQELSVTINGSMKKSGSQTTLDLQKLSFSDGYSSQEIPLRGVQFIFNEDADFPALSNYTELTSLTREKLEELLKDWQENLGSLFSIFGSLFSF